MDAKNTNNISGENVIQTIIAIKEINSSQYYKLIKDCNNSVLVFIYFSNFFVLVILPILLYYISLF